MHVLNRSYVKLDANTLRINVVQCYFKLAATVFGQRVFTLEANVVRQYLTNNRNEEEDLK